MLALSQQKVVVVVVVDAGLSGDWDVRTEGMRRGQRRQQGKGGLQFLSPVITIQTLLKDLLKLQKKEIEKKKK
nr:hypothetical protein BaRGS_021412 [Batillaria attramentaria]